LINNNQLQIKKSNGKELKPDAVHTLTIELCGIAKEPSAFGGMLNSHLP
jgi:hypothetical protein